MTFLAKTSNVSILNWALSNTLVAEENSGFTNTDSVFGESTSWAGSNTSGSNEVES